MAMACRGQGADGFIQQEHLRLLGEGLAMATSGPRRPEVRDEPPPKEERSTASGEASAARRSSAVSLENLPAEGSAP